MPDAEILKQVLGPVGAVVILAVLTWKLWHRNIDLQDKLDKHTDVLVGLVKDATKADVESATAARDLAQSVRNAAASNAARTL